jgi:hypothetical protein
VTVSVKWSSSLSVSVFRYTIESSVRHPLNLTGGFND